MSIGGILGSDMLDQDLGQSSSRTTSYNPGQTGVFGLHPLATPKYAFNNGLRDNEFKETLARMYVSLADASPQTKKEYLASLPKDDRTQALAQVLIGSGAGSGGGSGFIDFFLTSVQESRREKMQVDETLSDNYVVFYFGEEPPLFSYSGMLLNSQQDDQVTGFALAYTSLLRGTQLAQRGALLRLRYNGVIVSGTVNSMSSSLGAENELVVPFGFTMLVKEYAILRQPAFGKITAADFVQLSTEFDPEGILTSVGQTQNVRVRTTLLQPTIQASQPVVGTEEPGTTPDPSQNPAQQLQSLVDEQIQSVDPTSNIRGTLPPDNQSTIPPSEMISLPPGG